MKRILLGLAVVLFALPLQAGRGPGAVRKTIESSMLVTGMVDVDEKGDVTNVELDRPGELPEGIRGFVPRSMIEWKFAPPLLNGVPVALRNRFGVRLVAHKQENDSFNVRIVSAWFDPLAKAEKGQDKEAMERLRAAMTPPVFPQSAQRAGAEATVYLLLKVGADGTVHDVVTEQVNLYFVASANVMDKWRKLFADNSMRAARGWRFPADFHPALTTDPEGRTYWVSRVPVDYRFNDSPEPAYGQWETYVPGPWTRAPWQTLPDMPAFRPDTLAAGGVYPVGDDKGGLRLLTPLQEG